MIEYGMMLPLNTILRRRVRTSKKLIQWLGLSGNVSQPSRPSVLEDGTEDGQQPVIILGERMPYARQTKDIPSGAMSSDN